MKILCCVSDKRYFFHVRGLGHVFRELGHQFIEWDINQKPAFDAFDEHEPNIYLGPKPATTWIIKGLGSIGKCLEERRGHIKEKYLHNIPYAADTFDFSESVYMPQIATEVSYIGPYQPIHVPIFKALEEKHLQVKICGSEPWPLPQYLGSLSIETMKHFYKSSKVCLNFNHNYNTHERVYQILMAGSCPVSCPVGPPFNSNNLLIAEDVQDYANYAEAMCSNRKDCTRDKIIKEGKEIIRQGNTYFHRIATLFEQWGMEDEAKRVLQLYDATVKI